MGFEWGVWVSGAQFWHVKLEAECEIVQKGLECSGESGLTNTATHLEKPMGETRGQSRGGGDGGANSQAGGGPRECGSGQQQGPAMLDAAHGSLGGMKTKNQPVFINMDIM